MPHCRKQVVISARGVEAPPASREAREGAAVQSGEKKEGKIKERRRERVSNEKGRKATGDA